MTLRITDSLRLNIEFTPSLKKAFCHPANVTDSLTWQIYSQNSISSFCSASLWTKHLAWRAKKLLGTTCPRVQLYTLLLTCDKSSWGVSYEQRRLHTTLISLSSAFDSVDRDCLCTKQNSNFRQNKRGLSESYFILACT